MRRALIPTAGKGKEKTQQRKYIEDKSAAWRNNSSSAYSALSI